MTHTIHHGDCLDVLRDMPDNSVDAVVCDPPYGLSNTTPDKVTDTIVRWAQGDREYVPQGRGFMGASWDAFVPPVAVWDECLRVLKPGGHLVAFAGSRTQDLMGLAIRLAGFDIRENLAWLYGSGFPKSMDVSKAIDKGGHLSQGRAHEFTAWVRSTGVTAQQINEATGTLMGHRLSTHPNQPAVATEDIFEKMRAILPEVPERIERLVAERTGANWEDYKRRNVIGLRVVPKGHAFAGSTYGGDSRNQEYADTKAHTPEAEKWQGWGTALKPAHEPIILARKPFKGTVAANTLEWGTGGINVDACRIGSNQWDDGKSLCNSCAKPADETPRPGTTATKASTATSSAAPTLTELHPAIPTDSRTTTATGCSDGTTEQASASSSSSTATSGSSTTGAKSRTGSSSTTSTSARPTTGSKTCTSCGEMSTSLTTTSEYPTHGRGTTAGVGRWPSNVVLDPETAGVLDQQSGTVGGSNRKATGRDTRGVPNTGSNMVVRVNDTTDRGYGDSGGASRFFKVVEPDPPFMYAAKAPKRERPSYVTEDGATVQHATVKPLSIMQWLVRLVTPEGGTVLDPFAGSGTTVEAALLEGFNVIGIEQEAAYLPLIQQRIDRATTRTPDPQGALNLGDAA